MAKTQVGRRGFLKLALAAPVGFGLLAAPAAHAAASSRAVVPAHRTIKLDLGDLATVDPRQHARDLASSGLRAHIGQSQVVLDSSELATDQFTLAGLTWAGGAAGDVRMLMRTRGQRGWSEWVVVHDDGHGPDPRSSEASNARRGTEPVIAGQSTAVQVRLETDGGQVPDDLRVDLIDSGESPYDAMVGTMSATVDTASVPSQPSILTREDWGADESIRDQDEPAYGTIMGSFVHHTAGVNDYTQADVPGILRGIYVLHVQGREWRDIGYNFLIDKFGRIWEGRYGGINEPVVGAHTEGYNSSAFGASAIGNYNDKEPEAEVLAAYTSLIAWKFGLDGVDPEDDVSYPDQQTLPAISGHRDAKATDCPGHLLYNELPALRDDVAAQMRRTAELILDGPKVSRFGRDVNFSVSWAFDGEPVSGRVELQSNPDGEWLRIDDVVVTDGSGAVTVSIDRRQTFRLRARSADSHDDIDFSDPAGTSNSHTVVVVGNRARPGGSGGGNPFDPIPV